jgi:hypothetical protein
MISRYENGRRGEPPSPGGWRRYGTLQSCVAGLFYDETKIGDGGERWRVQEKAQRMGKKKKIYTLWLFNIAMENPL